MPGDFPFYFNEIRKYKHAMHSNLWNTDISHKPIEYALDREQIIKTIEIATFIAS